MLLTRPDVIARELERLRQNDPTEAECAAVDRALSDVRRKSANLARSLALFDDAEAAAPVVAQIESLRSQERAFNAEREEILGRRERWTAGQQRLANLQAWCSQIGARFDTFTYDQRRTALNALGVQARVWKVGHDPRYVITASLPLDGPTQTGQDSRLYAASQNIHS
jgi:hypothetical protein